MIPSLETLAKQIRETGAPALPSFLLVRQAPVYEVEFEALEFAEETKLAACDWAVLALADALGEISPRDVDGYLGLGEAVSEVLVHRLIDAEMLSEVRTSARLPTAARQVKTAAGADTPMCGLSDEGREALRQGAVVQRRSRPARTLFTTDPLHYLDTVDEKRHRFSQHRRPPVLEPDRVPECLRDLEAVLDLPPEERVARSGILHKLAGIPGELIGVVHGAQWAVRPVLYGKRPRASGEEPVSVTLVLAAFPSSDEEGLAWRTFIMLGGRPADAPNLSPARLLEPSLRTLPSLLSEVHRASAGLSETGLRADGAINVACMAEQLEPLLGEGDRPGDVYLSVPAFERWTLGVRAHVVPVDATARKRAFLIYLRRRESQLQRDFDAVCAATAGMLTAYWGESHDLPAIDELVRELWASAELRAALCKRRLHADLVAPYLRPGIAS